MIQMCFLLLQWVSMFSYIFSMCMAAYPSCGHTRRNMFARGRTILGTLSVAKHVDKIPAGTMGSNEPYRTVQ